MSPNRCRHVKGAFCEVNRQPSRDSRIRISCRSSPGAVPYSDKNDSETKEREYDMETAQALGSMVGLLVPSHEVIHRRNPERIEIEPCNSGVLVRPDEPCHATEAEVRKRSAKRG